MKLASEIRVLDTFFPLIMFDFGAVLAVLSFLLQKAIDVLQESMLVIKQSKLSDIRHPTLTRLLSTQNHHQQKARRPRNKERKVTFHKKGGESR